MRRWYSSIASERQKIRMSHPGLPTVVVSLVGGNGCATIFESADVRSYSQRVVKVRSTPPSIHLEPIYAANCSASTAIRIDADE